MIAIFNALSRSAIYHTILNSERFLPEYEEGRL